MSDQSLEPIGKDSNELRAEVIYNVSMDMHRDVLSIAFDLIKTLFYVNAVLLTAWVLSFRYVDPTIQLFGAISPSFAIAAVGFIVCGLAASFPGPLDLYFVSNLKLAASLENKQRGPASAILSRLDQRVCEGQITLRWVGLAYTIILSILWALLVAGSLGIWANETEDSLTKSPAVLGETPQKTDLYSQPMTGSENVKPLTTRGGVDE